MLAIVINKPALGVQAGSIPATGFNLLFFKELKMNSMPIVKIVDINNNNEIVEIEDLTDTGIGMCIADCEKLLSKLQDAHRTLND